jgi:hypothetical protein
MDSTPSLGDCETGVVSVMIESHAPFALPGTHRRKDRIEIDVLRKPGVLFGRCRNLL